METIEHVPTTLASVNAILNTIAFILLVLGYRAIRKGDQQLHKKFMVSALAVSAAFLTCYLIHHYQVGSVKFQGEGFIRTLYFLILVPHVILAALMTPAIVVMVVFAFLGKFEKHKKIARIVWPVWAYVSVTGVLVYLMLYHL
jgi:uncharacterized membrane protein YozB (DUF420 family)